MSDTTTNTPFEKGLDEILAPLHHNKCPIYYINPETGLPKECRCVVSRTKAALTQLHKAAIVAELEAVQAIPSEVGKLANHSLRVSEYLEDRIEQYKKEAQDE